MSSGKEDTRSGEVDGSEKADGAFVVAGWSAWEGVERVLPPALLLFGPSRHPPTSAAPAPSY